MPENREPILTPHTKPRRSPPSVPFPKSLFAFQRQRNLAVAAVFALPIRRNLEEGGRVPRPQAGERRCPKHGPRSVPSGDYRTYFEIQLGGVVGHRDTIDALVWCVKPHSVVFFSVLS